MSKGNEGSQKLMVALLEREADEGRGKKVHEGQREQYFHTTSMSLIVA